MISDEQIKEAVDVSRRVVQESAKEAPFAAIDAVTLGLLIAEALREGVIDVEVIN